MSEPTAQLQLGAWLLGEEFGGCRMPAAMGRAVPMLARIGPARTEGWALRADARRALAPGRLARRVTSTTLGALRSLVTLTALFGLRCLWIVLHRQLLRVAQRSDSI